MNGFVERMPLSHIVIPPDVQVRDAVDEELVHRYAQILDQSTATPTGASECYASRIRAQVRAERGA